MDKQRETRMRVSTLQHHALAAASHVVKGIPAGEVVEASFLCACRRKHLLRPASGIFVQLLHAHEATRTLFTHRSRFFRRLKLGLAPFFFCARPTQSLIVQQLTPSALRSAAMPQMGGARQKQQSPLPPACRLTRRHSAQSKFVKQASGRKSLLVTQFNG